jgi:diguanylate cyclase (GGDEF)-like protein
MEELDKLADDWQETIDLMAQILDVPSGLLMRLTEGTLEVFVSSQTDGNPFKVGSREFLEGSGLYCETVIKTNSMLKVTNALADNDWKDNTEVNLNMISYLGFPISWPNGDVFGTICVLDEKENHYSQQYEKLVEKFKSLIEKQLEIIHKNRKLKEYAEKDSLTGILNRRTLLQRAQAEHDRAVRYGRPFSLLLFDIDHFKIINDSYGHQAGDEVIISFTDFIGSFLRTSDVWGRYGGEEFMAVLAETEYESAKSAAERFIEKIPDHLVKYEDQLIKFTVSVGVGNLEEGRDLRAIIRQADDALYQAKRNGRNRVQ